MLAHQLDEINKELKEIELSGKGGGLNMSEPKTLRDAFMDNFKKF